MTTNDTPARESDEQAGDKPLKAILGRPQIRPGETKEEAARRLARELFGRVSPGGDGPQPPR